MCIVIILRSILEVFKWNFTIKKPGPNKNKTCISSFNQLNIIITTHVYFDKRIPTPWNGM